MTTLYTLQEVAEQTGFALRSLQRDARAGTIAHTHRGRRRLMTEEQVALLVKQFSVVPNDKVAEQANLDRVRAAILGRRSKIDG